MAQTHRKSGGRKRKKPGTEMSFNRFVIQCIGQSASANALENSIELDAAEKAAAYHSIHCCAGKTEISFQLIQYIIAF